MYCLCPEAETLKLLAEREAKNERVFKEGISSRGRGAPVWKTPGDAIGWLSGQSEQVQSHGLAVFEVEGQWERDTMQFDGEPFERLIVSRPLKRMAKIQP